MINRYFSKTSLLIFIALAALITGLISYRFFYPKTLPASQEQLKTATLLKKPRNLDKFLLTDMRGKPFIQESLTGKWGLVFFGFSHCPSVCPTALANLNKIYRILQEKKIKSMPNVIFVSVDPERDSPKRLKGYLAHFNPKFLGVTGNEDQINQLAKNFGAVYMEVEGEEPNSEPTIDHSSSLFVTNPEGQFYALFSSTDEIELIANDLTKIIQ